MKILFVHNNFPAQFVTLATELAQCRGVELAAIGSQTARELPGVRLARYASPVNLARAHSFARRFDNEARRAEEVMYAASTLIGEGFCPDLIFVHPGWGESLPLRAVFPAAKIVVYCEYYYRRDGGDVGFDPEFPAMGVDGYVALDARNAATALALASADAAISPTQWQKSTFPKIFQPLIEVAHEGVDTDFFAPDAHATFRLPDGAESGAGQEIVTYTARSLDPARVVFLPRLPYSSYLKVLQVSAAHVYLTYPFVLSWSLLEAMSAGCRLIGSDTAPVRELIDGTNGALAPMFDIEALAAAIVEALASPERGAAMRDNARATIRDGYDRRRIAAPRLIGLIEDVMATRLKRNEPQSVKAPAFA